MHKICNAYLWNYNWRIREGNESHWNDKLADWIFFNGKK